MAATLARDTMGPVRLPLVLVALLSTSAHARPIPFDAAKDVLGDAKDCTDVPCLIAARYAKDDKAKAVALALFEATGDLAGLGKDEIMEGGYRGKIHLVPQLPVGSYRTHLAWTSAAMTSIDEFFTDVFADQKAAPSYRWHDLAFRFVKSPGKKTPSAYAGVDPGGVWTIVYNVEGSLLISEAGVLETLWHELFHTNDQSHRDWSARTLQTDYAAIVAKCGTKLACLEPYAPNRTIVRGGTYYAFQPDNGETVHEYAAELALRYFNEQREMLAKGKLAKPAFKCGPAENARAWKALVDEFFGARDLVPVCAGAH